MSVRPKKHLGQHFLWDKNIAQKIVQAFKSSSTQKVLEVGPGKGVLSQYLLPHFGNQFYAVEIDEESARYLLKEYPELGNHLIEEDFIKMKFTSFTLEPFSIIGNFPYNISSQIFFKILDNKDQVPFVIGMVQKEVAERISAKPGSKTYGILSVLLQAYYDVKMLFKVGPGSFQPPPKVNSAVVELKRNNVKKLGCDEKLFFRIVKQSFNQRRKIIRNSLKSFLLNLEVEDNRLQKRPEQLSVQDFVDLSNLITQ
jgi:16S rRNA (adenine1518-N6/adenine1519-N6)-dimethyltransferase